MLLFTMYQLPCHTYAMLCASRQVKYNGMRGFGSSFWEPRGTGRGSDPRISYPQDLPRRGSAIGVQFLCLCCSLANGPMRATHPKTHAMPCTPRNGGTYPIDQRSGHLQNSQPLQSGNCEPSTQDPSRGYRQKDFDRCGTHSCHTRLRQG